MREDFNSRLKDPIFGGIAIDWEISFQIFTPDLVIKLSANMVRTSGTRNWLEVLVG